MPRVRLSGERLAAKLESKRLQLSVSCPFCGAKVGKPCRVVQPITRRPRRDTYFHKARWMPLRKQIIAIYSRFD